MPYHEMPRRDDRLLRAEPHVALRSRAEQPVPSSAEHGRFQSVGAIYEAFLGLPSRQVPPGHSLAVGSVAQLLHRTNEALLHLLRALELGELL